MGRAGYSEDIDNWQLIRWRGQVASSIKGKRGQEFLKELVASLDALPEKELITNDLERDGAVCAIGSVGLARRIDMSALDPEDPDLIASAFGIAHQLVREIEFMNDEGVYVSTPHARWHQMRQWALSQIISK